MGNHMGERIQEILSEDSFSDKERFVLEHTRLICRFRLVHREIKEIREDVDKKKQEGKEEVVDKKRLEEKEKKRSILTEEIIKSEDVGSDTFEIDRLDLRLLIDYIVVDIDQEGKLQGFFEKVEEKIAKMTEGRKPKKH